MTPTDDPDLPVRSGPGVDPPAPERSAVITQSQAGQAVLLLRECAGRPAAEQFAALVGLLGLTVMPDPVIPEQRR